MSGNSKPELKEMTGAFVVKFIRRPASEGINRGISEGINGGVNDGINRLLEFIHKNPGQRVVELAATLNIPPKTIERWIKKLKEQKRIVFTGSRKTGGYHAS
jgi:ATP-dependent DNA helicase RecG